jgi:hypothetical protein
MLRLSRGGFPLLLAELDRIFARVEITGTVVHRRDYKLSYAQITFNLYDASGAQVGTALANINGLEPGGRWNFEAVGFSTNSSTYKVSELTGF